MWSNLRVVIGSVILGLLAAITGVQGPASNLGIDTTKISVSENWLSLGEAELAALFANTEFLDRYAPPGFGNAIVEVGFESGYEPELGTVVQVKFQYGPAYSQWIQFMVFNNFDDANWFAESHSAFVENELGLNRTPITVLGFAGTLMQSEDDAFGGAGAVAIIPAKNVVVLGGVTSIRSTNYGQQGVFALLLAESGVQHLFRLEDA